MDPLGERLPYVVTLLFAAIGWGVTHTVDRVLKSPIVEYRTQTRSVDAHQVYTVRLRNLSREAVYENVNFVFLLSSSRDGVFVDADIVAVPPAWEGDKPPLRQKHSVQFPIPALYPAWEFELRARYTGSQVPVLRMEKSKTPFRLSPPSLETFLYDNEIPVIAASIGIWAALLLFLIGRRPAKVRAWPGSSR